MSNKFPFVVYQSPDGWSVVTATTIICHNADEVTAMELTEKAFPGFPLIAEAFADPSDVLTWRATFQEATAAMLAEQNEQIEDLTDATAEELDELRESIINLNTATEEHALALYLAELRLRLAEAEAEWRRVYEGTAAYLNKPHFHPNIVAHNRRLAAAAAWDTTAGERVLSLRQLIKDLE